jgi:anti-sigma B factor antagonist
MKITISMRKEFGIVKLTGELLGIPDQVELREKVSALVSKGTTRIIVDLGGLTHINSCGLGALVCLLTTARKNNGDVVLVGMKKEVRDLFNITWLEKIFRIYPTLEGAIAGYSSN